MADTMNGAPSNGKIVLLIDDDLSIRKVVRLRLERAGYHVLAAEGGDEGLRLAKAEQPSIILLDLQMPKMDGREVLKRLKDDPATQPIPVILLSVVGTTDEMYVPMGSGQAANLSKPYQPHELLREIQAVLTERSAS